jgi:gamma-glutamyl:cysteine ligase YbdK (ATP-grasp superfamily)
VTAEPSKKKRRRLCLTAKDERECRRSLDDHWMHHRVDRVSPLADTWQSRASDGVGPVASQSQACALALLQTQYLHRCHRLGAYRQQQFRVTGDLLPVSSYSTRLGVQPIIQ